MKKEIIKLAKYMHDNYESISKRNDWKTQKKCQVEFKDLPPENKYVMEKLAEKLLTEYFVKE